MNATFLLFIKTFLITFAGFVLCGLCQLIFDGLFDSFHAFLPHLLALPYLLYAGLSVIVSGLLLLLILKK